MGLAVGENREQVERLALEEVRIGDPQELLLDHHAGPDLARRRAAEETRPASGPSVARAISPSEKRRIVLACW